MALHLLSTKTSGAVLKFLAAIPFQFSVRHFFGHQLSCAEYNYEEPSLGLSAETMANFSRRITAHNYTYQ